MPIVKKQRTTEEKSNEIAAATLLPLDIIIIIFSYVDDLGTAKSMLKASREFRKCLSTPCILNTWKLSFESLYLEKKTSELRRTMQEDETLPLFDWAASKLNAVMSGSYLLKCISNSTYYAPDVNIYIPLYERDFIEDEDEGAMRDHIDHIYQFIHSKAANLNMTIARSYYNLDYDIDDNMESNLLAKGSVCTKIRCQKMEFIIVLISEGSSIEEFFEKNFDLSFCVASFDGKTIRTKRLFEQLERRGRLINQSDGIITTKTMKRCQKYYSRGFSIELLQKT